MTQATLAKDVRPHKIHDLNIISLYAIASIHLET